MHFTRFIGLTELDPNDPLTVDGSSFTQRNPSRIDYFVRIGAVTHRHDAHQALANPSATPSASIANSGGQIGPDTSIYVAYTLIDSYGGETTRSGAAQVSTPASPPSPSAAVAATFVASAGNLPVGQYQYAVTLNDPSGGESTLGPAAFVWRQSGYASGEVLLTGLAQEIGGTYVSYNLWRAQDGGDFEVLATNQTSDSFIDSGLNCSDCSRQPPADMSGVSSTYLLEVTLPTAAQDPSVGSAASYNLYLSLDGSFQNPALYGAFPLASAGQQINIPVLLTGQGEPPAVSLTSQGANQIDPDTDLLDWHWKRPVHNSTDLPLTGNASADARVSLVPLQINIWNGTAWVTQSTGGGGGSGGGGIAVAGPGGVGEIIPDEYIEFAGSGGVGVSVINLGGGSARVLIGPPPDVDSPGGSGGGISGIAVAGDGGAGRLLPETYVEFAGSGSTGVAVQDLGGGSARVLVSGPASTSGGSGSGYGAVLAYAASAFNNTLAGNGTFQNLYSTPINVPAGVTQIEVEATVYAKFTAGAWMYWGFQFAVDGAGGQLFDYTEDSDPSGEHNPTQTITIKDVLTVTPGQHTLALRWTDISSGQGIQVKSGTLVCRTLQPTGAAIVASGGSASGAVNPFLGFSASGGVGVRVRDLGGGSAVVEIGGAGLDYRVFNVKDYGAKGDGSDDTTAITNCVNDMIAAGSGTVLFPAGLYVTGPLPTITVPCQIIGAGKGAGSSTPVSVIQLKGGSNDSLIKLAAKGVTIADLSLYGNSGAQTGTSHGITTSATIACNYFRFRDVWISSFLTDGINLSNPGSSLEGEIKGVESRTHGSHGIVINSGCADISMLDTICAQNGLSGLYVNAAALVATGVHCWGNGTNTGAASGDCAGLFMPSGAPGACRFTGCYFETNGNATTGGDGARPRGSANIFQGCVFSSNKGRGMYAFSNTYNAVTGCTFNNNNQNGTATTGGAGLTHDTCTACTVVGNAFYDSQTPKTQTYGYAEVGNTCTDCAYDDNICRAADHKTGATLIGSGNPNRTIVGMPLLASGVTGMVPANPVLAVVGSGGVQAVATNPGGGSALVTIAPVETGHIAGAGQAGMYSHSAIETTMSAANVAASASYFKRIVPGRDMLITKIAIGVATGASQSDQVDVGIYDVNGNLLSSVGISAPGVNSTGVKLLTLTSAVQLHAGQVYYVALAYGGLGGVNAANFNGVGATFAGISMFGAAIPQLEQFKIAANFPLATVANFSGFSSNGACPLFALRES